MKELHDRLDRVAGPAVEATGAQAAADLARGRRALRHRRRVKGAATGVFAVAAAVAALAYGTTSGPASAPATQAAAPTSPAARPAAVDTVLVAYKGDQPKGYTIDKVPSGWEIQGADPSVLTIAPINDKDKDPHTFVGKIAIMLQSKDQLGTPSGTAVAVGGKRGVLVPADDGTHGKSLYVRQPNGINLIVQIWDAQGWTDHAIVEFAAGIHVLADAQQGVG
jgi:hypothetical protein